MVRFVDRRAELSRLRDCYESDVAAAERDHLRLFDLDETDAAEHKSAYVSLTQNHLSKLADANGIIWNDQAGRVGRGQSVEGLARLISLID